MTTSELNKLAGRVHQLAKDNGWHSFQETDEEFVTRAINNLHGEISELWEAHRAGKLNQPCDKAERMDALGINPLTCAEEELADIVIRELDVCKRCNIPAEIPENHRWPNNVPDAIYNLHDAASVLHGDLADISGHSGVIGEAISCAALLKIDLWSAVERKHQYNASREYRHGGKVA